MMTSFIEQMNDLNSLYRTFRNLLVTKVIYRFLSSLDGDISNEIELESQGERMIRNELVWESKDI